MPCEAVFGPCPPLGGRLAPEELFRTRGRDKPVRQPVAALPTRLPLALNTPTMTGLAPLSFHAM